MQDFKVLNFFVGINGAGKSRYLNQISQYYNSKDCNILQISNSVFDRLYFSSKKIKKLTMSNGNSVFTQIMSSIFSKINYNINSIDNYFLTDLKLLARSFEYAQYSSQIEIKIFLKNKNEYLNLTYIDKNEYLENEMSIEDRSKISFVEIQEIKNLIYQLRNHSGKLVFDFDENYYLNNNLRKISQIFDFFHTKKYFEIHYSLKKNNMFISLEYISSGELHIILSLLFISANIDKSRKNIIVIDEPEVSLHPKWQKDYVDYLFNYFYMYNFTFFFATHSPLIMSKIQYQEKDIEKNYKIFKINNLEIIPIYENDDFSIEYLYWDVFRVLTPQSSFLSRYLVDLMSKMDNMKIKLISKESYDYQSILKELEELKLESFSYKQKNILDKIIQEYK